jgi:DNA-binding SARP family transcriptional activator
MVSDTGCESGMAKFRIELFGAFRVSVGGRAAGDDAWHGHKPAAVIKLLALEPSHRLHREQLMDVLWPELEPSAAAANLRKAVHYARRALEPLDAAYLVASRGELLSIPRGELSLDVDEFRTAVAAARRAGEIAEYRRAVELYRDGLLPEDRYEPWAVEPREELRLEFVTALDELTATLEAHGEIEPAIAMALRVRAEEELREESHVRLMRLYALAGRRQEALRAYEHLCKVLADELGVEPAPATQRLAEEIRARQSREPDLTADLWERVGDLRVLSGDASGATKAFAKALAADPSGATARIEWKCAEAWLVQHRPTEAGACLQRAASAAADAAERGRIFRVRANHAWELGDIPFARRCAERALEIAVRCGTAEDGAAAREALAVVSHFTGEWREGVAAELERLASEDADDGQLARVFDIHHCIGQYHLYGDGLAESVEDYARRLIARAEEAGAARAQAFAWCLLGESALLHARWDEAAGCLARSCELHAGFGSRSGALPWQRRAEVAVCRGAYGEAEDHLRRACAIATVSAMARHVWGRIHATAAFAAVEQGDPQRAVRSVRAAGAAAARYGDCPTCSALLNPVAAEAFALLDDPESARAFVDSAARVARMFASSAWQAMAESAAGSLAAAESDKAAARHRFDAARELYGRAGQPYWAARCERLAG